MKKPKVALYTRFGSVEWLYKAWFFKRRNNSPGSALLNPMACTSSCNRS